MTFGRLSETTLMDTMQESTAQRLLADSHELVALCPR